MPVEGRIHRVSVQVEEELKAADCCGTAKPMFENVFNKLEDLALKATNPVAHILRKNNLEDKDGNPVGDAYGYILKQEAEELEAKRKAAWGAMREKVATDLETLAKESKSK